MISRELEIYANTGEKGQYGGENDGRGGRGGGRGGVGGGERGRGWGGGRLAGG